MKKTILDLKTSFAVGANRDGPDFGSWLFKPFCRSFVASMVILLTSLQARSFINIEEVRREAGPGFVGKSTVKINGENGNSENFNTAISTLNIYRFGQHEILFLGDYNFAQTLGLTGANNAKVQLRYTSAPEQRFSLEYFVQDEYDEFRQLKARELGGANIRPTSPLA